MKWIIIIMQVIALYKVKEGWTLSKKIIYDHSNWML